MRLAFAWIAALAIVVVTGAATFVAPHSATAQSARWQNAPPTAIHLRDETGAWHRPFIYPLIRVDQLEQIYRSGSQIVPLRWFRDGHLVTSASDADAPLFLLGADSLGRDVFSRVVHGARWSLVVASAATALALLAGMLFGAWAGSASGLVDDGLMRLADLALLLPGIYVGLLLRSLLPLVLPVPVIATILVVIFAVMGAPLVARGVRGIVRTERDRDYVVAARSLGAGRWRILTVHILPATANFLAVQATLLVPAFIIAEATFSYVGLGFPESVPTWGTMLVEAGNARALADFPWVLSPAVAIFVVVLTTHAFGNRFGIVNGSQSPL